MRNGKVGERLEKAQCTFRLGEPPQQDGLVIASSRDHRSQMEPSGSAMRDSEEI